MLLLFFYNKKSEMTECVAFDNYEQRIPTERFKEKPSKIIIYDSLTGKTHMANLDEVLNPSPVPVTG